MWFQGWQVEKKFKGRFYLFRICAFKNGPQIFLNRKIFLFLGQIQILVVVKNGVLPCKMGFWRPQTGPNEPKRRKTVIFWESRHLHLVVLRKVTPRSFFTSLGCVHSKTTLGVSSQGLASAVCSFLRRESLIFWYFSVFWGPNWSLGKPSKTV